MNNDQTQENDQITGKLKASWSRLSNDDVALYHNQRDQFSSKLQEKYGLAKDEAENQLRDFERTQEDRDAEEPKDGNRPA